MRRRKLQGLRLTSDKFKSNLERNFAKDLEQRGISVQYETHTVEYVIPARTAKYTPDFPLPNGITIEVKGYLKAEDRAKHILLKQQFPEWDLRFCFQNANNKIYAGSPTSYGDWATHHGFKYCEKFVPKAWLDEPTRPLPEALKQKTTKSQTKKA